MLNPSFDPPPLRPQSYPPLAEALESGALAPSADVLVMPFRDTALVLITMEMIYYHAAQGEYQGEPWLISFCAACNAGVGFTPVVRGRVQHFSDGGVYNAMTILKDEETRSLWNHISGEAMYGEYAGERLPTIGTARHLTAAQALAAHPNALLVHQPLPEKLRGVLEQWNGYRISSDPPYLAQVESTLGAEDTRLPRLDMGLGVWTPQTQRYYPMSQIHKADNALIDTIGGRGLLVYIDPESNNPSALYTDAQTVTWRGGELILNSGARIRSGILRGANGAKPERPRQLFMRWYGFAFMFPGCEIYQRDNG